MLKSMERLEISLYWIDVLLHLIYILQRFYICPSIPVHEKGSNDDDVPIPAQSRVDKHADLLIEGPDNKRVNLFNCLFIQFNPL